MNTFNLMNYIITFLADGPAHEHGGHHDVVGKHGGAPRLSVSQEIDHTQNLCYTNYEPHPEKMTTPTPRAVGVGCTSKTQPEKDPHYHLTYKHNALKHFVVYQFVSCPKPNTKCNSVQQITPECCTEIFIIVFRAFVN